jgi:hypothetical protein
VPRPSLVTPMRESELAKTESGSVTPAPLSGAERTRRHRALKKAAASTAPLLYERPAPRGASGPRRLVRHASRAGDHVAVLAGVLGAGVGIGGQGGRTPAEAGHINAASSRAGSHSITSSARAKIAGGMVRPSVFAVFRLTVNWKCVGPSIGSSAAEAPRKMRAT